VTQFPHLDGFLIDILSSQPALSQADLKFLDPALNESLFVLGSFQLGVIEQFAAFDGLVQPVGDLSRFVVRRN
jgi:hypothetical protein